MRRHLSLIAALLLFVSPANAATYYASSSTGSNSTGDGTIGNPYYNYKGSPKAGANALNSGDFWLNKRGDVWEGTNAEFAMNSLGVHTGAYGTGRNPVLYGAAVTSAGWSLATAPNIYSVTGQSQTHLKTVVYSLTGNPEDYIGLSRWGGSVTTVPSGAFIRSGSTLYVNLGGSNPATSNVRIGSFASYFSDGARGLLRTTDAEQRAAGQTFRDHFVIGANGVGYSSSGPNVYTMGLNIIGAGMDGHLYYFQTTNGEDAEANWDYYSEVSYSASNTAGSGQGITNYGGSYNGYTGTYAHDNFMAGFDNLNLYTLTGNAIFTIYLRVITKNNGLAQIDPSYDGNWYNDAGHDVWNYGMTAYIEGVGTGTAGNARTGVLAGSEYPSLLPCYNVQFVNLLSYGTNYLAFGIDNTTSSTANITGISCYFCTLSARNTGYNLTYQPNELDVTQSPAFTMKYSILRGDDSEVISDIGSASNLTRLSLSYNNLSRRGGSTNLYKIGGANKTLAQIQALGLETSSIGGDPLFDTESDTAMVATLQAGSPAIDAGPAITAGMVPLPSWLPQTIKDDIGTLGVRGSAKSSGVEDNWAVAADLGAHKDYAALKSTSFIPASLVASASGNATVSFTIPQFVTALLHNWDFAITLPSGWSWNSGGTTAVTSSTITGTWTVSVNGQTATFTRVGDGMSEFPGSYTMVVSRVGNSATPGASGTFTFATHNASGTKIAEDTAVPGVTLTSSGGGAGGGTGTSTFGGCTLGARTVS